RSQHESLIAFSNSEFYGGQLITFPGTEKQHSDGVRFEYVADGVYDYGGSRTNRREAERVVDTLIRLAQREPASSLGVVALSGAQQAAIREALANRFKSHPELGSIQGKLDEDSADDNAFFVKNLESVQGDERDIIVLSIGYGPDKRGVVHSSFGPVNRKGGERRLNVAVTRARQQMVVVSSIRGSDINPTGSVGAQTLRRYLTYAEKGVSALTPDPLAVDAMAEQPVFDSPFEQAVYGALSARGLRLVTQVGCSGYRIDLAARDPEEPDRYVLGIECDGRSYHSSKTARDRDRLRQAHLESLGWTIHRIWSSDWFANPEREIEKTLRAFTEARDRRSGVAKRVS
ncbi:MAG TPA: AAA domain-containing protein, partial [Ktedonobacterales bacterium]